MPRFRSLLTALTLVTLLAPAALADLFLLSDSGVVDATSTLHVEFTDGFAVTYEVSYDSTVTLTGTDLLDLVVTLSAADALAPTLSYAGGGFVSSMTADDPATGIHTDTPIFDGASEGPYWGYWVTGGSYADSSTPTAGDPAPWDFASFGSDDRFLADGSFDGWNVTSGFGAPFGFDPTQPGSPANSSVPEPSSLALIGAAGLVLALRRRRA